jgi:diaminohydroxyphosphoribosylaminopyrimidine deaminase/5-amino-6-(5-phosphoribosylamino)uracil reductase
MSPPRTDTAWMARALALAARGEGRTRPNPPVGAVVVGAGRLLGEGFHAVAGGPHAEVAAIRACRQTPRGATLYVTLEPCCTHGRTPPCTDLILASGIRRVVAGCHDPDPRHRRRGFDVLRRAGVDVVEDVLEPDACRLIEPFAMRVRHGRPFVTLKLALTLDGRIADRGGHSQWITGPRSRAWVQRLRQRCDAVMVGAGTVRADDPSLLCRLPDAPPAWRVIVDGRGRVPASARVLADAAAERTLLVTTRTAATAVRRRAWERCGAKVWGMPARNGRFDLALLLRRLAQELGLLHVLCEGGAELAGALVRAGLVDEYALFYGPLLLADGLPALTGPGFLLSAAPRLGLESLRRLGNDVLLLARPGAPCLESR